MRPVSRGCAALHPWLHSVAPPGLLSDGWTRSCPKVLLVEFDPVLDEQRPELVLKCQFPVMLLLVQDVGLDGRQRRVAHRERPVPSLPPEILRVRKRVMDPTGRAGLEFAQEIGQRDVLAKSDQRVHMVLGPANLNRDSL